MATVGDVLRLSVERMAYGPEAIAHGEDGRVIFVAGGVPGDVVSAEVVEVRERFSRARVLGVVEPSARRVDAFCPYAGVCGGCPWAQVERGLQLEAKRSLVVDALVRIGHMDSDRAEALVSPTVDVGPATGYRNKIELDVLAKRGRPVIGMHAQGSADVIRVDACPLFDAPSKRALRSVTGALGYLCGTQDLGLERIGMRSSSRTGEVEVALWTRTGSFPRAQVAKVVRDALPKCSVTRVMLKGQASARKVAGVECLSGKGHWTERVLGETMRLSAPSFFQVNTRGAERLVEHVLDALDILEDDEAMDLYCGAGTFTLPLARRVGFVSAVESYGPAVRDLRRNLEGASFDNVDAIGGDADLEFPDTDADVIVVDPPRAGLAASVIEKLSSQPARAIAYVSCDPATLARDIARFEEIGAFSPASVTPHDLFPQTFHVETVCLLCHQ